MKKLLLNCFIVCIAAVLLMCLSVSAFAVENDVVWCGRDKGFNVNSASEYTATDLFDNFKGVMPGDKLSDMITVTNAAEGCDYIKVYLRAESIDDSHKDALSMEEFLSKLTMRVYNGEILIFESSPDKTGSLTENTFLAKLSKGESTDIHVELDVPISLDNAYADRLGEVDWVFGVEEYEGDSLIQTGQLNWPVPVLACVGAMFLLVGIVMLLKKRKDGCA